jgi:uncharacterized protein YbjT (DUF2867 family)
MSTDVLVTGATGRAGTEMVRRLAARDGVRVRAASHFPDREADTRADAVDFVEVDFDGPETLDVAFRGIDKAVLITPEDVNMVRMTERLVRAAERAGVSRLVRVSFINAGTGIGGRLLDWHREAETIVAASPIPSVCLRPNSYMQNFLTMYAPSIFVRGAFYTPMGNGRISYIDARDVADAGVEALLGDDHAGEVFDLTGPVALAHDEIAEMLSAEIGRSIGYVDVGEDHACAVLERKGASPALVEALCELWMAMRHDAFAATGDGFERLTGRRPRDFGQFVRDHRSEFAVSPTARAGGEKA